MGAIIPKLRASARGQQCTLVLPSCNHDPETTVLAHLPSPVKGMGNKGDDHFAVFACSNCHHDLDHRVWNDFHLQAASLRGLQRTQKYWFDNGYLVIPGVLNTRAKPSPKIMPRKAMSRPRELTGEK